MKVLIACEESQRITIEMRKLGHECYSCDIDVPSGGHPEWHILHDVLPYIDGNCTFTTMDGVQHTIEGEWDLLIAHPPCTYLTCSGNRWFNVEKYGDKAIARMKEREKAIEFFMKFINAKCEHICVENPVGYMNTHFRKPDQIIQPFWFGDPERKTTCLWLKNLPHLTATNMVDPDITDSSTGHSGYSTWHMDMEYIGKDRKERSKMRSKTFPGIARAIASKWGEITI
jgi:hypothetical protein